jgi:hypothetical protein
MSRPGAELLEFWTDGGSGAAAKCGERGKSIKKQGSAVTTNVKKAAHSQREKNNDTKMRQTGR